MGSKYNLGIMDLYNFAVNDTEVENTPFIQVKLKENIDEKRLREAVCLALRDHPLFACTLRFDKGYYLEENDRAFTLICAPERERPLEFGDRTAGYLWQLCYDGSTLIFEWAHGVSDVWGGYAFLSSVLCCYFGEHKETRPSLELGLESIYDRSVKGLPQKPQEKGHRAGDLPYLRRGYKTDCHVLKAPMKEVLSAAKRSDSSLTAVLLPLFSRALRGHISPRARNKNVCCNLVIDCRSPMKLETMHNCIVTKNITYTDRFDTMDPDLVSTMYRSIIDIAVQRDSIIAEATKTVDYLKPLVSIKALSLQKTASRLTSSALKHSNSNFTFTYLGGAELPEAVAERVEHINLRSWTNYGECNISAIDLGGALVMNICENYKSKQIVPDFIKLCGEIGIHFKETECVEFEQANLRLDVKKN